MSDRRISRSVGWLCAASPCTPSHSSSHAHSGTRMAPSWLYVIFTFSFARLSLTAALAGSVGWLAVARQLLRATPRSSSRTHSPHATRTPFSELPFTHAKLEPNMSWLLACLVMLYLTSGANSFSCCRGFELAGCSCSSPCSHAPTSIPRAIYCHHRPDLPTRNLGALLLRCLLVEEARERCSERASGGKPPPSSSLTYSRHSIQATPPHTKTARTLSSASEADKNVANQNDALFLVACLVPAVFGHAHPPRHLGHGPVLNVSYFPPPAQATPDRRLSHELWLAVAASSHASFFLAAASSHASFFLAAASSHASFFLAQTLTARLPSLHTQHRDQP